MMDDPALYTNFLRNTLGITTQQTTDLIMNVLKSFTDLLAVNDGYIDTFVKCTHYAKNARAAAQRILISNNVNQGLKYMFF